LKDQLLFLLHVQILPKTVSTTNHNLVHNEPSRSTYLKNDVSCKLWRESSLKDNAEVRRLLGLAEGDDTRFEFEEQLRRPRMKIEYRGKPYNCTKCGNLSDTTTICEIKKNYKCAMVRGMGANAEWRCDQEKRGTRVKKQRRKKTRMVQSPLQKKRRWRTRIY
jgi:hypothetical protein